MIAHSLGSSPLDLIAVRRAIDDHLFRFIDRKARAADAECLPEEVVAEIRSFISAGGKRIRPLLCVVGWHAAGGSGDTGAAIRVAGALEMFHAFALIHDDVMDHSSTRRGRPTVHRTLAVQHADRPDAQWLGTSAAILVGDLALVWSDELLHTAGLSPEQLAAVLAVIDAMRVELVYGQYLDVLGTGRPTPDVEHALRINRFKSAKYTIERPLHVGAALAGASPEVLDALSAFALPAGEAFQLRDDLLGAFGDPALTGKVHEDLRDAKHTVLMSLALGAGGPGDRHGLRTLLGRPERDAECISALRAALEASGARTAVEDMISDRCATALRALDTPLITLAAAETLRGLTFALCERAA